MIPLNQNLTNLKRSPIRRFTNLARETPGCAMLTIGEPDLDTPEEVKAAAIAALNRDRTHYAPNQGTPELREAVAAFESARGNLTTPGQVLVTVGASEGIDLALRAILEPGDEVIIPDPSYVSYMPVVTMCGGTVVPLETRQEDEFRMRPEALKAAITPKTKAVIFPYPNNPTGGIMEKEDLEAVAAVLRDTNIMVVSDEIYSELTYNDLHHVSIATIDGMYERTIVLNGFSKSFAMTGWRQGYLCGPAPLVEQMVKIHQYTMLCAPSMGQAAALSALENAVQDNYADVERMKKTYNIRRRMLLAGLKQIGLPCFEPKGAFYAFPDIRPTGLTSEQFCDEFLMQQHVACVPGTAFGASGEGFIRISYATATRDIERALEKMDVFVKKYRG